MAGKVFISYRREDTRATAGRIYDRLVHEFGASNVFMDVDSIPPGGDFAVLLEGYVADCDVMLVIIGPNWVATTTSTGERRLFSAADAVQIEIASAITQGKHIIPVLVDKAEMLTPGQLPESIARLERLQAIEIRHNRFSADIGELIAAVETKTGSRRAALWPIAAGLALLLGAGGAVVFAQRQAAVDVAAEPTIELVASGAHRSDHKPVEPAPDAGIEALIEARVAQEIARLQAQLRAAEPILDVQPAGQPANTPSAPRAQIAHGTAEGVGGVRDEEVIAATDSEAAAPRAHSADREPTLRQASGRSSPDAATGRATGTDEGPGASGSHNGSWTVRPVSPGCGPSDQTFTVTIVGDKVLYGLEPGRIAEDGTVQFIDASRGVADRFTFQGRIIAGEGRGNYVGRHDGLPCEGTFSMMREPAAESAAR